MTKLKYAHVAVVVAVSASGLPFASLLLFSVRAPAARLTSTLICY